MADVKWIKITTDIFDDEKIQLIESLPSGDSIIVVWFKILAMCGRQNNNGILLFNNKIPYTEEMLATLFRRDLTLIREAFNVLETFGMLQIVENVYTVPNWEKHQNIEGLDTIREQNRLRQQRYRDRQKQLALESPEERVAEKTKTVETKHKHGENDNVLLKDSEYNKLVEKFGKADAEDRINNLSWYIASKGNSYKDHYKTILAWARKDSNNGYKRKNNTVGTNNTKSSECDYSNGEGMEFI